MKKILFPIIALALVMIGCDDDAFLERAPHAPTDRSFYTTEAGAQQGLIAAYDVLQLGEDIERVEFRGTVCSGDAMAGGEPGGNDQPAMQDMMRFIVRSNNLYASTFWQGHYRGIYRCNLLISYLTDDEIEKEPGFEQATIDQIVAEAKFLRGLFHFKLQQYYGGMPQMQDDFGGQLLGIPFIEDVLPPDQWNQERPSLEYTWGKIEQDFVDAAAVLPEKSAYPASDLGRATKGAALAMLAKTYLYQEKWADAYTAAKQVIESDEYWLEGEDGHEGPFTVNRYVNGELAPVDMPAYKWIFQPEANNSGGSVFSVQHFNEGSSRYPQGQEGNLIPQYYGPRRINVYQTDGSTSEVDYFWGFILPTDYFVNTAFRDNGTEVAGEIMDPRFELSVVPSDGRFPYYYTDEALRATYGDSVDFVGFGNWPSTGRSTWKYFTDPNFSNSSLGDRPQNTRYLRFADVLLMGAEAAVHEGQMADATTWINRVRNRARNSGNTGHPADYAQSEVTLDAIYAERRVELAFEGHQFFDLVRTGRIAETIKGEALQYETMEHPTTGETGFQQFGNNFQIGKHELMPIPENEIENTNGSLTQNPNYE